MEYGKDFHEDSVKIALRNLSIYSKSREKINDANYFIKFYYDSLEIFKIYAASTDSSYMVEKLKSMPELTFEEVDDYINPQRRSAGAASATNVGLIISILNMFRLIKKEGITSEAKLKLDFIANACDHMLYVIENPMFAQAIIEKEIAENSNK